MGIELRISTNENTVISSSQFLETIKAITNNCDLDLEIWVNDYGEEIIFSAKNKEVENGK